MYEGYFKKGKGLKMIFEGEGHDNIEKGMEEIHYHGHKVREEEFQKMKENLKRMIY